MRVRYFHADERTSPLSLVNQALPEIAADDELSGTAGNCRGVDPSWPTDGLGKSNRLKPRYCYEGVRIFAPRTQFLCVFPQFSVTFKL